jgi:transposase
MVMDERRKTYRRWNRRDGAEQAYVPQDVLPQDDLVFFVMDVVPNMDLRPFYSHYERELRGQPPFDVTMMVILLVYAYSVGVFSSRKITAACERNLAFRVIVGNDPPDFRTISDFRKIHRQAFRKLFLEVLTLAGELGMVQLGNLATDGSKFEANASRHKAMSYGYMKKEIQRLEAEIDKLLEQAERVDAEQDAAFGSRRGDELPEELKRREDRLEKIRQAKARLEAEAKARAEQEQRDRDEQQARRQAEGKSRGGQPPARIDATPEDKAQTNFTDPEAKIMKRSNKGFDYCYNAQVVVDAAGQIIVAAEVTPQANDKCQAVPMAQTALSNLEAAEIQRPVDAHGQAVKIPNTADSGYFSEGAVRDLEQLQFDPHIATGRQKHHDGETLVAAPGGEETVTVKEQMARKLQTPAGRGLYAARKHIVEPVFGQIKHARGFRKFLLRGLNKVAGEWQLVCLCHNLLKIWRIHGTSAALSATSAR